MRYPFSAKKWSIDEWDKWLTLLKEHGLKRLMLWPGFEFFDETLDKETDDWLEVLADIIKKCKLKSIEVYLGRSPNGYIESSSKKIGKRNQHDLTYCDPCSEKYLDKILIPQERILKRLPTIDGWWVIDSDPADAMDLDENHFAKCFEHYRSILPVETSLVYWMWGGWTNLKSQEKDWRTHEQTFWKIAAEKIIEIEPQVEFLCCWSGHGKSLRNIDNKKTYFPYHKLEPEPSIPFIYHPDEIDNSESWSEIKNSDIILNMQTPCLRTSRLLEYLTQGCFSNQQTEIETIADNWCWNEQSLLDLRLNLNNLGQNEVYESMSSEAINRWKNYIQMDDVVKRGYLVDVDASK